MQLSVTLLLAKLICCRRFNPRSSATVSSVAAVDPRSNDCKVRETTKR